LGIFVVPQSIGNDIDLLVQTWQIDIAERSLKFSNRLVVEVVRKIGVMQLSEWDWKEQYRWGSGYDIGEKNDARLPEIFTIWLFKGLPIKIGFLSTIIFV
jgi:hypothetical protein